MQTDVLIVGAGPTGLMLANQLARRGVRPMIVDRHSGPAQQSRAMAVQARTLEIYSKMGIIDQALDRGFQGTGANMWTNGTWAARIPVGEIGKSMSPFPFVLMLGQDDNERIMGAKLREYGVDIQWSTELVSLEQKPEGVDATLKQPDGSTLIVRASWVGGCDGSRSVVRELNGITFPGAPYEHVFFVADTEATGPMKPGELNIYMWQEGFHLFFPMKGKDRWRVIGILPKPLREREDLRFEDLVSDIRREAGAELSFPECSWFSTYRIFHRCADRFRDRRCFLLGDAAHIHSPAGGQGMNTGLQDAYNLGWKLALVVKGQANAALLDSYEAERLPVAQRLLQTTDRAFRLIVSDSWLAGLFRTRILARIAARAMTIERIRKLAFRTIAQIGIQYRASPLSQMLAPLPQDAPLAGDRFPWVQLKFEAKGPVEDLFRKLDDTRFNLLVIGQPVADVDARYGELVRSYQVPDDPANTKELARVGITGPAFYLLRPDGHVGLAGTRLEQGAVGRYASSALGLTAFGAQHHMERSR
ncbi:MAG: FAD-dependent monooxygenase [Burkholderiaceae bacterium]|nr:FAD-dependent monooxygenase [Burkholderiaceae bacterium]